MNGVLHRTNKINRCSNAIAWLFVSLSLSLSLFFHAFAFGNEGPPYAVIFYGAKPPKNVALVIEKNLTKKVKSKIPVKDYELIVFAEANAVIQKQNRAYVCSVTVGFSRKVSDQHLIPNIRFNSIGFSLEDTKEKKEDQQWEQDCIENSLAKALSDLSQSDLDYIKFLADK